MCLLFQSWQLRYLWAFTWACSLVLRPLTATNEDVPSKVKYVMNTNLHISYVLDFFLLSWWKTKARPHAIWRTMTLVELITHRLQFNREGKSWQELKVRHGDRNRSRDHGRQLLGDLLPTASTAWCLTTFRTTCPKVKPAGVVWTPLINH